MSCGRTKTRRQVHAQRRVASHIKRQTHKAMRVTATAHAKKPARITAHRVVRKTNRRPPRTQTKAHPPKKQLSAKARAKSRAQAKAIAKIKTQTPSAKAKLRAAARKKARAAAQAHNRQCFLLLRKAILAERAARKRARLLAQNQRAAQKAAKAAKAAQAANAQRPIQALQARANQGL